MTRHYKQLSPGGCFRREGAVDAGIVQPPDMCRLPAFAIRRDGRLRMVRPPRYALAVAAGGAALDGYVRALHECDVPMCVRVITAVELRGGVRPHVVGGTQRENMERMARARRGGDRLR